MACITPSAKKDKLPIVQEIRSTEEEVDKKRAGGLSSDSGH